MVSTLRAKLTLRAQEFLLTTSVRDDYYLTVKLQECLSLADIAKEVAALSTRQEDAEDVERIARLVMEKMAWFLSAGYSISTPMGYYRPTVSGVMTESELTGSPDRDRLKLGVTYTMNASMREALDSAKLDVEILKNASGPQLYQVVSIQDAQNPEALTRGTGVGIQAGEVCVIKGKRIKVGGTGTDIGVTITRQGDTSESYFFPVSRLYPNTATQVGFVMPASAAEGSVWSVTLCTKMSASGKEMKTARTVTMADYIVVGQPTTTSTPDSGGSSSGDSGSSSGDSGSSSGDSGDPFDPYGT